MQFLSRPEPADCLGSVNFLGAKLGLLGQVKSARGVRIVATYGMPNGKTENRLTSDKAMLVYTPRQPADSVVKIGRQSYRSLGSLNFIKPNCSLKLRGNGHFVSSYCVLGSQFLASLSEAESGLKVINELDGANAIESVRLRYLGAVMLREALKPGFSGALFAESMGISVAVEISRLGLHRRHQAPAGVSLSPAQMAQLESYMHDHLSHDFTLRDLATELGINARRLSQAVRKEKGMSIHRWLAECRLAEARRLLTRTSEPIADIAQRTGFQGIAAFSMAFRAATGFAPDQFRRLA
jgi:AraC-like DNA-binding protein